LCDRLAIIDNGRIVNENTPNRLKQQIAGDIISLGLDLRNGAMASIKENLRRRPFLRELEETTRVCSSTSSRRRSITGKYCVCSINLARDPDGYSGAPNA